MKKFWLRAVPEDMGAYEGLGLQRLQCVSLLVSFVVTKKRFGGCENFDSDEP